MRAEIQQRVQKIKKASAIFRVISRGLLLVIALATIAAIISVVSGRGGINYGGAVLQTAGLTLGLRLLLGLLTALAWSALFICFYYLQHLFGTCSRGEIFSRESVRDLRRFGVAYVLWGLMNFVWMVSLAVSVRPAQTYSAHFDSLGIGAVIILVAWFMDVAVDLREENELTI